MKLTILLHELYGFLYSPEGVLIIATCVLFGLAVAKGPSKPMVGKEKLTKERTGLLFFIGGLFTFMMTFCAMAAKTAEPLESRLLYIALAGLMVFLMIVLGKETERVSEKIANEV